MKSKNVLYMLIFAVCFGGIVACAPASDVGSELSSQDLGKDFEGPGTLKPTIYYFAIFNEDEKSCSNSVKQYIRGEGGKKLLLVCPQTKAMCALQGTCAVTQNKKTYKFNIIGTLDGQERFFKIEEDDCKYGFGVRSSCLDPFYTLAADLTIYDPGDVIYVPAVVGTVLPDGSKHNGYFIVRDKGDGIKGRGRFDFYTGFMHWRNTSNPFQKMGLADKKTNIPYYRVHGESAKKILEKRGFPELPASK